MKIYPVTDYNNKQVGELRLTDKTRSSFHVEMDGRVMILTPEERKKKPFWGDDITAQTFALTFPGFLCYILARVFSLDILGWFALLWFVPFIGHMINSLAKELVDL